MLDRRVRSILTAQPASDGGGVKLFRIVGPDGLRALNPFLLLDEFGSDQAEDYLPGFPEHPHRGFETLTYMLEGDMAHADHLGHRGVLSTGGVQWMTAGRGIIHSEMPRQRSGRMRGLQLWINLPAAEKLKDPAYRNYEAGQIPVAALAEGVRVKVIAGRVTDAEGREVAGAALGIAVAPTYLHVVVPAGAELRLPVERGKRVLLYLLEGVAVLGSVQVEPRQMAVLTEDGDLVLRAGPEELQAMVLAADPLDEPVVSYGPFVMNSRAEIKQAISDYESGRLAA